MTGLTGSDNLAMLGRAIGGLLVVLVLIALIARFARRRAGKAGGSGLRVVERLGLSREANLAVIEVSNRTLLLGVTAQGVTMLASLDDTDRDTGRQAIDDVDLPAVLAEVAPAPVQIESTSLDLTGLEREISRPRADSPVGTGRPVVQEISGGVPNGVALGDYPDLASALRAAGRTADSSHSSHDSDGAAAPRTRAEARAQGALTASSGAARARTRKPKQKEKEKAPKPGELKVTRLDDATPATPAIPATPAAGGKGPAAGRVQASGSVLSPRTWRQGVDALRELTVRRG